MRILITGASGHTGSRLAAQLVRGGNTVHALTRDAVRLRERLPDDVRESVTPIIGDLNEAYPTELLPEIFDAVIAVTHIRFAPQVVALCRDLGVRRVIFMSSTRRFTRFPEDTARAVIAGESAVADSALDYTVIRPTMIYGGERDNNLTHLVRALRRFPVHPLPAGGMMLRQPVFTWDVVAAVCAALERPATIGKMYTVAGPQSMTYRELITTILRGMGCRRLLVPMPLWLIRSGCSVCGTLFRRRPLAPDQIERLSEDIAFDMTETLDALGYTPTPFAEGIRRKLDGTA